MVYVKQKLLLVINYLVDKGFRNFTCFFIISEVMQMNSNRTQAEAVDEYMYHMQHVSDRVRCARKAAARVTTCT